MKTLLKTNDKIRAAVAAYNNEFSYRLNGIELSFTGSRIKGFELYFKVSTSGRITSVICSGRECDILTAIHSIYQFSGCPFSILKPLPADSRINEFVY